MKKARSTYMDTRWTAPGEGAYLIELIFAACTIRGQREFRNRLGDGDWGRLDDLRRELENCRVDTKLTRCELAIENPRGAADIIDAGRVVETMRRAILRHGEPEAFTCKHCGRTYSDIDHCVSDDCPGRTEV